jgi:hypothetical protein
MVPKIIYNSVKTASEGVRNSNQDEKDTSKMTQIAKKSTKSIKKTPATAVIECSRKFPM